MSQDRRAATSEVRDLICRTNLFDVHPSECRRADQDARSVHSSIRSEVPRLAPHACLNKHQTIRRSAYALARHGRPASPRAATESAVFAPLPGRRRTLTTLQASPTLGLPIPVPALGGVESSSGGKVLDDAQVRERVRGLLTSGRLPSEDPVKLWAGPSMAKPCSCCGEIITTATEYELDFSGTLTILFHPRCYAIWNGERKRMTDERRRDRPSQASGT